MTDSANTRILSRRWALIGASTGIAAAAIGGRAAQAMAPAAPAYAAADAELVDMCRRWIRLCRFYEHACEREDLTPKGAIKDRLRAAHERLGDKMEQFALIISNRPAATWRGVGAKAEVLASDLSLQHSGDPADLYLCLMPLLPSLINDVNRLNGSAAAVIPVCEVEA